MADGAALVEDLLALAHGGRGFCTQCGGTIECVELRVEGDVALRDGGRLEGLAATRVRIGAFAQAGQAGVGGGGLGELAGAAVGGDEVDQAVVAAALAVQLRPRALVDAHHAGHDLVGNLGAHHQRAALVVQFDQIAVLDAALFGIGAADGERLARLDLVQLAYRLGIGNLRMQAVVGVGAYHVHLVRLGVAQIFGRRQELGHGRHVVQTHLVDGGGIHLDLAARGMQRVLGGVCAEFGMAHPLPCLLGHLDGGMAFFPELGEGGVLDRRGFLVGLPDVIHRFETFGKGKLDAAQGGQAAEDLEIIQRIAHRGDQLLHGKHLVDAVGAGRGDVVALHGGGGRQHDVGPARGGIPPAVLHDHGVHALHGTDQRIRVLLVAHEVVAGVVDQLDLGVGVGSAVIDEGLARTFQHLGDARGRADLLDRVAPLRQTGGCGAARLWHAATTVVPAEAHALTRQADVAQHAGEVDDGPVGHLAVVRALDRPRAADLRALAGHQLSQFADLVGRNACDLAGPFGGLGRGAVLVLAQQVGLEAVEADGVLVDEILLVLALFEQVVAHGQEQGGVGVGDDLYPFRSHLLVGGGDLRVDGDELAAGLLDGVPAAVHFVVAGGVFDAVVLVRIAAHQQEDLGVVAHLFPGSLGGVHLHVADHHGHDDLAGSGGPVAGGHGRAAQQVEEPALQHIGTEDAAVRPATVGTAEAAFVAVLLNGVQNGLAGETEGGIPAHLHPFILAAQFRLVAALVTLLHPFQIGLAYHGTGNAGFVIGAGQHAVGQHGRRHLVVRGGGNLFQLAVGDGGHEGAVVVGVEEGAGKGLVINGHGCRGGCAGAACGPRCSLHGLRDRGGFAAVQIQAGSAGGAQQLTTGQTHDLLSNQHSEVG